MNELLRRLPQMGWLLESEPGRRLAARYSREEVAAAVRETLGRAREAILSDAAAAAPDFQDEAFFEEVAAAIESRRRPSLRRVINATGVIVHTNLGRARLAPEAVAAMSAAGAGYSNLELDLESGARGTRHRHVEDLLRALTCAEAAMVVNNGAGAVVLCLMALARDREVIASRGELIEIGGGFRMPDVITEAGARLREAGTTNKTRLADYEQAIGPETAILLKSHASNFRIIGFTAAPKRRDLADLAASRGLISLEDLGSGVLIDLSAYGLRDEPTVGQVLGEGIDLVTFSGDKLLGGPQAGVIAGRKALIDRLAAHPMARALRIDKLSLAALEATLRLYRPPHDPMRRIPVLSAIGEDLDQVWARARTLTQALEAIPGLAAEAAPTTAYVGGGSLPQQGLASAAATLRSATMSPDSLAGRLRAGEPAVMGRIADDRLWLDMRTVDDAEAAELPAAIRRALAV